MAKMNGPLLSMEARGMIVSRPRSGYYVAPHPVAPRAAAPAQVMPDNAVDINTYIFDVLQASCRPAVVPFGSAFPDPRLFPLAQLNRSLAGVGRYTSAVSITENLPPGNAALRYAIARRYAQQGIRVSPDEIVITAGALEALNARRQQLAGQQAHTAQALSEAHRVQTQLIESDEGEGKMKVSLVLVHAQDHLMTSMLARELVAELIELHEKVQ
mgnify:CR=1 FL=1